MTETDIRKLLEDEAVQADLRLLSGPALRAQISRPARMRARLVRPALVAATAAMVGLVALYVVPSISERAERRPPPASADYSVWPIRGDLAADAGLLQTAVRAWDAAPIAVAERPHRDVRVLYAGTTDAGRVVVLTGRNALGSPRWAVLASSATSRTPYRGRLRLLLDRPAPNPRKVAGLFYTAPRATARPTEDRLVVALGAPTARDFALRRGDGTWQALSSIDGAAVTAVVDANARLQDVSVRWRADERERKAKYRASLEGIDYQPDPRAVPEPRHDERCSGGTCVSTVGGSVSGGVGPPGAPRTSLLESPVVDPSEPPEVWEEYHTEAVLLARLRYPESAGYSTMDSWSGLLPDGTGGHLAIHGFNDDRRLVLYADHPSAAGGVLVADVPATGTVPVVTAVVDGERGRWLMAPAVPGWRVQVQVAGGPFREATRRGELLYRALPSSGNVKVRVLSPQGQVVHSGAPDGNGPLLPR